MRYLSIIILALAANIASAQQVNPVTDYTFANRMSSGRSTVTDTAAYFSIGPRYGAVRGMMPPMVTDTTSMSANKRNGLLIFSIQKNKYQVWDSAGAKWADITGAAGSAIISADTAAMLLPYLRKADTTAMLNPYLRGSGTANYLPIFDATRSVINSKVYQSGNHLMFNTTTPSVSAAEYGTMDVNGSENAAYILKVADAEKSYILSNGTDLTISNNPAGDLIFRNNNVTRGRFTSAGQFRVNNLASASTRLVTADTDGNLAGTVSITQFIDTTEISTRAWVKRGDDSLGALIALKVNISDTSSMLSPYLRKADTTAMLSPYARTSNVNASLALKLNISDTATMLSPYLKESDTAFLSNRINLKVNISDTASMLTNYIRHAGNGLTKSGQALSVDTAAIATRARVQKGIDSVATLATAGVTSVATGYGLSGGTITTTGTIIVDSAIVASRLRVGKVVDSLSLVKQNLLTNPVTGTGTTNYVPKFTGTSTIGNSSIFDNGTNVGIGQTNPLSSLEIGNGTGLRQVYVNGGGYDLVIGASGGPIFGFTSQNISAIFNTSADPLGVGTNASQPLILGTAATERMRIDATGKIGVNVTPSAWSWDVLQVGRGSISNTSSIMTLGANVFYDGAYKYIATGTATAIEQNSFGAIKFLQASSGSAGGTATMNEVLTMNSNAELLLNTTTDAGDYKLQVSGNAYVTGTTVLAATSGTANIGSNINLETLNVYAASFPYIGLFSSTTGTTSNDGGYIGMNGTNMEVRNKENAALLFYTNNTTQGSFNAGGELLLGVVDQGNYKVQVGGAIYTNNSAVFADGTGGVSIGTTDLNSAVLLQLTSTTKGFLPPRMTTTQRDAISSPPAGLVIYNTTTSKLQVYTTAWTDLH